LPSSTSGTAITGLHVAIFWADVSLSNPPRHMTSEDIQSLAGALSGVAVGLTWAFWFIQKENARRRAESEWLTFIYKNVTNIEQRKRLLFTPRCDLSPAELELLTPPAYRARKK
jgi:hypothetical protein